MPKVKRGKSDDDDSSDEKNWKRYRVTRACTNCQKAHVSCEQLIRPCKRCIEKGISSTCVDGIQRKRGKKKKEPLEVSDQSNYEHEWYNFEIQVKSADEKPMGPINWTAVAAALPVQLPTEDVANFQRYTFVHFDPETGDYIEDAPAMSTLDILDHFWSNTDSLNSSHVVSSPVMPLSPYGQYVPAPFPLVIGLRNSFSALNPDTPDGALVLAVEEAEAEEEVKEVFRQSFDLGDNGQATLEAMLRRGSLSTPDFWGPMQEAVESSHLHGYSDSGLAPQNQPLPPPVTASSANSYRPEENLNVNDASFILWKLSHEPEHEEEHHHHPQQHEHAAEPRHEIDQEHLKV